MPEHEKVRTETAPGVEPNPDANELDTAVEHSSADAPGDGQDETLLDQPQRNVGGILIKVFVVIALVALMIAGLVSAMQPLFWIALVLFFFYGLLLVLPVLLAGGTKAADRGR